VHRWSTSERTTSTGAIESRQWIALADGFVASDEDGARRLGLRYLDEVRRSTHGLVRPRAEADGTALLLVGAVRLLRFGPAELVVGPDRVECHFPIRGGLLAARPEGSLVVAQRTADTHELELLVAGYFPRLGGSPRRLSLRRALYAALQARAHRVISRRFLERAAGQVS
jgi:hypothetical protein